MGYRGIVKGNVVLLAEGVTLPEGTAVEVTPVGEPLPGSPAALLHVWGSDVPDEAWDAVEPVMPCILLTTKSGGVCRCSGYYSGLWSERRCFSWFLPSCHLETVI